MRNKRCIRDVSSLALFGRYASTSDYTGTFYESGKKADTLDSKMTFQQSTSVLAAIIVLLVFLGTGSPNEQLASQLALFTVNTM